MAIPRSLSTMAVTNLGELRRTRPVTLTGIPSNDQVASVASSV